MSVTACPVPQDALLHRYVAQPGCYTDCFETVLPGTVALSDLIEAFYTTWLFRLERLVLTATLRRRIRDADVRALADGAERFAAWRVEARAPDELLLCDLSGHTRSYLRVEATAEAGGTRLCFGSAVVPPREGEALGPVFRLLLPAHKLYSRGLLALAAAELKT